MAYETQTTIRSRAQEKAAFEGEIRDYKKELRELPKKMVATEKLLLVAQTLQDFMSDVVEMTSRQENVKGKIDTENLVSLATSYNRAYNKLDYDYEKGAAEQKEKGETTLRPMFKLSKAFTGKEVPESGQQLLDTVAEKFKEKLNSSLPQLQALMDEFFPKVDGESDQAHKDKEAAFLFEIAKFLRLNQDAIDRSRALGGLPDKVGGVRNTFASGQFRNEITNGILMNLLKNSPLCDKLQGDLSTIDLSNPQNAAITAIEALHRLYQQESAVLNSSENIRRYEYRRWLSEHAGRGEKIAFTPHDQMIIKEIQKLSKTSGKVAGPLLYGSPGTGKTELIAAASEAMGIKVNLLASHRNLSATTLIGEAPITLVNQSAELPKGETAWVDGEIQKALLDAHNSLLDEMDKAPSHAFDGISALLAKSPGESIRIGGKDVHLPYWYRIFGTANRNNLPDHMKDRFPSLKIEYPDVDDLLRKVGFWLSSEHGEFKEKVTERVEWQTVLFFTYIAPRIHQLYNETRKQFEIDVARDPDTKPSMQPFSMRGMKEFCSMIAAGEPIDRVIENKILKPGVLAEEGSEVMEKLLELVRSFKGLEGQFETSNTQRSQGVERMLVSPLYGTIAGRESAIPIARERQVTQTALSPDQLTKLESTQKKLETTPGAPYRLPSGLLITQRLVNDKLQIAYKFATEGRTTTMLEVTYPDINNVLTILDSDVYGEQLIVKDAQGTQFSLAPVQDSINPEESLTYDFAPNSDVSISRDGKVIATHTRNAEGGAFSVTVKKTGETAATTLVPTVYGEKLKVKRYSMSEDGTSIVLESITGQIFVLYPQRSIFSKPGESLKVAIEPNELKAAQGIENWQFNGNLLWTPNSSKAFIVS